jgi:co-chaperonin GroES (HSP10)
MKPLRHPGVNATVEQVHPMGDFVVVKPLLEDERTPGGIFLPDNLRAPERGLRRGLVVAVGKGDPLITWQCSCGSMKRTIVWSNGHDTTGAPGDCEACGKDDLVIVMTSHASMEVRPGDEVIYPRVPANMARIGDTDYVFLREEQHAWAVIERNQHE